MDLKITPVLGSFGRYTTLAGENPLEIPTTPAAESLTLLRFSGLTQTPQRHALFSTSPASLSTKAKVIDFPQLISKYGEEWKRAGERSFVNESLVRKIAKDIGYDLNGRSLTFESIRNLYFNVFAFFSLCLSLPDMDEEKQDVMIESALMNYPSLKTFPPFIHLLEFVGYIDPKAMSWAQDFLSTYK